MKRILSLVILGIFTLISLDANAYARVDEICYNILSYEDMTCEVVSGGLTYTYHGNIVIPSTVEIDGKQYKVVAVGGSAFAECNLVTSVSIPESITKIGDSAFQNCTGLTSIVIPNSVTEMQYQAFCGCSNLTSITISNAIEKIEEMTFNGCGFTTVDIPNSVKYIGDMAFFGCYNLESVTIPSSVTYLGPSVFGICQKLKYVYVSWDIPLNTDGVPTPFGDNITNMTLYVPSGMRVYYGLANLWKEFGNIVEMVAANNISLDAETKYINIGDTLRLHATIEPADAYNRNVVWSSSDESVATVDKNGLITAIKEGDATITVAIVGTDIKASCNISIRSTDVTGVELNTNQITFNAIGESVQLTATVEPEYAANKNVTWKSSNESVCVVSPQGKVVTVGYGSAAIIATTEEGGYISACSIKVAEPVETPEDVNHDGKVNATDAMLIYNYILSH